MNIGQEVTFHQLTTKGYLFKRACGKLSVYAKKEEYITLIGNRIIWIGEEICKDL